MARTKKTPRRDHVRTATLKIRLTPEERNAIDAAAEADDRPATNFARRTLLVAIGYARERQDEEGEPTQSIERRQPAPTSPTEATADPSDVGTDW